MPRKSERPWVTLREAAQTLRIAEASVRKLITLNILTGKQVVCYAPWVIERAELDRKTVIDAANRMRARRALPSSEKNPKLPFET